jgi:hypothetical protein
MKILNNVIKTAADIYGVDPLDNCRKRPVVYARNAIYAIARDCYGLKYKHIGKALKRDHSTVIYGYNQHQILMQYDKVYREQFDNFYQLTHNLPTDKVKLAILYKLKRFNHYQLSELLICVNAIDKKK